MKSNIQLKHGNYAAFSHFHGCAVNNLGLIVSFIYSMVSKIINIDAVRDAVKKYFHITEKGIADFLKFKNFAVTVFLVLLFIIFLKMLYNAIRSGALEKKKILVLLRLLHIRFVHDIRSKIVEINYILPRRISNAQDQAEDMKVVYDEELERLKNNITPYVDALGDYLTSYRNEKVSVCIKTFLNGSIDQKDYMDEEIITIARSKNTIRTRKKKDYHALVKNNSDFIDLCYGRSSFFGKAHLKHLYNEGLYKNDSPNWWKQYNCTLVAPIRYYNKDNENTNVNVDIDIIGFLCIDCKQNIDEWENRNSFELQVLAVLADSLYTYLRSFYNCFEEIGYFKKGE